MISAFVVLECSVTHTKNPKLTLYHKTRAPAPITRPKGNIWSLLKLDSYHDFVYTCVYVGMYVKEEGDITA